MFLDNPNSKLPSLGSLAAQAVLKDSESTLKKFKDESLHKYSLTISHMTEFDIRRTEALLKDLDFPNGVSIYTTGSDGRLEKACRKESPIEFIMICNSKQRPVVEEKINKLIESGLIPIDKVIEWKDPETDSLVDCNCYKIKPIIPSRFLHNLKLVGSEEQLHELTEKFVSELSKMNSTDRSKFSKKFVTAHMKQLIEVSTGKETEDVNLAKGVISFSGLGGKGTKHSLLRPIQYTLDLILVDAIRKKGKSTEEFVQILKEMPRQAPNQIDFMYSHGFLSNLTPEDIRDLKNAYTLGLFYFQTAQHLYSSSGKPVEFAIPDKEELAKAYQDTSRILAKI
jgi:hypothetical protein